MYFVILFSISTILLSPAPYSIIHLIVLLATICGTIHLLYLELLKGVNRKTFLSILLLSVCLSYNIQHAVIIPVAFIYIILLYSMFVLLSIISNLNE